jgi:hypothetical protein
MSQPIALLAFANDQLPELVAERKGIQEALRAARERGSIELECEPNAGVADIFTLFGRHAGRIAVFHYGGHANGQSLQLQSASGSAEVAHGDGLAAFLGRQAGLKLVFLNACATAGQVDQLLAAGVKAVIATAAPVDDEMARVFALRFYASLGGGATLGNAFDDAAQEVATRWGRAAPLMEKSRGGFVAANQSVESRADPSAKWSLYPGADAAGIFDWKLPTDDARAFSFRAAPVNDGDRARVNTALAKAAFAAAEPYSDVIAIALALAQRKGRQLPEREVRSAVIDAFPAPVGEQLRKLFGDETIGSKRLEQLVVTYETVARLMAFTLVAQVWDMLRDDPTVSIDTGHRARLQAFACLTVTGQTSFDYFALIAAASGVLKAGNIKPFMPECESLEVQLAQPATAEAHRFLEAMRARGQDVIAADEVESLCLQAEEHLTACLCTFAFVAKYKLATVKDIQVRSSRLDRTPRYVQTRVMLDRANDQYLDEQAESSFFTDDASVILMNDDPDNHRWLNITPFVIDENALRNSAKTKLYFFSHVGDGRDIYSLIGKSGEQLAIDGSNFPLVQDLMADFRRYVGGAA